MAASNNARPPKNPLKVAIMRSTKMESSTRSRRVRGSTSATSGSSRFSSRRIAGSSAAEANRRAHQQRGVERDVAFVKGHVHGGLGGRLQTVVQNVAHQADDVGGIAAFGLGVVKAEDAA